LILILLFPKNHILGVAGSNPFGAGNFLIRIFWLEYFKKYY